jgi:Rap guanine nucleotide exchange factor 2
VIRGTPQRLLAQLIDENNLSTDPTFVEDFLLTHRTFMSSQEVIEYLLQLMNEGRLMDRVTRVLLLWVSWNVEIL